MGELGGGEVSLALVGGGGGRGACVGGLQSTLEDIDGVVLSCYVAEIFGAAGRWVRSWSLMVDGKAHYFSTHGWRLLFSLGGGAFDDEAPLAAAASLRALMSKKLAIATFTGELANQRLSKIE